jgi:hypothetical protein
MNEYDNNPIPPSESGSQLEIHRQNVAKELYQDLTDSIHPLDNPKLYDYLLTIPDEDSEKLLHRYRPKSLPDTTRPIPRHIDTCLFHPGITVRSKDFLSYVDPTLLRSRLPVATTLRDLSHNLGVKINRDTSNQQYPIDLIKAFQAQSKTQTLYRGMALTEQEVETIMATQLVAPGMRDPRLSIQIFADMLNPDLSPYSLNLLRPNCFKSDCVARMTGDIPTQTSLSLSTSTHPEVAGSIGWHDSGRKDDDDVDLYLFTLQIPDRITYTEASLMNDNRLPQAIQIDQQIFKGKGLEILIPFVIKKEWIKGVQRLSTPPQWHKL